MLFSGSEDIHVAINTTDLQNILIFPSSAPMKH